MRRSRGETARVDGRARNPCRKSRDESKPILRARTRLEPCLGARRRRVLEDSRADKGRCHPDGVQRGDERKLERRRRSYDQRCGRRVLEIAGTNQSDGAFMLTRFRVRVHQLVPLRRDTQRQRGQKCGACPSRNDAAKKRECQVTRPRLLHCVGHSLDDAHNARTFLRLIVLPHKRNKTRFVETRLRLLFLQRNANARSTSPRQKCARRQSAGTAAISHGVGLGCASRHPEQQRRRVPRVSPRP